jgi:predicted 3-demethylubiquinone-9 3-methyltransferase (glyoxalase superfamily)
MNPPPPKPCLWFDGEAEAAGAARAMSAMMNIVKLDIAAPEKAYRG